jgi:hypothetical protein
VGSREFAPQVFLQMTSFERALRLSGASVRPRADRTIEFTLFALWRFYAAHRSYAAHQWAGSRKL